MKVSKTTVYRLLASNQESVSEERKDAKRPSSRVKVDGFQKQLIRKTVHDLYGERVLPTVPVIQARLKANTDIMISNDKLRLILHELNYVFRKTQDNRRIAVERPEATVARARFLREIKKYREQGYQIVYVDETWVNQYHCRSLAWYPSFKELEELMKSPEVGMAKLPNIPSGKGKRIVVLHAGSAEVGFIPDVEEVRNLYVHILKT